MKKQILFLTFLVLASFASVTNAFAQYDPNLTAAPTGCPTPIAVTCLSSDALHPVAGTLYTYSITVPTPSLTNPSTREFTWFVTQDVNFITTKEGVTTLTTDRETAGGDLLVATGTGYNDPATGTVSVDLTWNSFTYDPTNPVFVVAYVRDTEACTTDNIQVYKIEPQNAFTLDLANIGNNGAAQGDGYATCVHPVVSATYDPSGIILMDYGVNYLYFAVTAANWTGAWDLSVLLQGNILPATDDTRIVSVDWAYPAGALSGTWNSLTGSTYSGTFGSGDGMEYTGTEKVTVQDGSYVGSEGECIIIRVTVDNNQDEAIDDMNLTLAVDGVTYYDDGLNPGNPNYVVLGQGDIHFAANPDGNVCPWIDGYDNDHITQVITQRPEIIDATDPAGDDFIPKN